MGSFLARGFQGSVVALGLAAAAGALAPSPGSRMSEDLAASLATGPDLPLPTARPNSAARREPHDRIAGPVEARLDHVVDGDTIAVRARVWIGEEIHVLVRLRGIDAPELKGRCKAEREAARRASNLLARLLGDGPLTLSDIGGGKYFGRVLADVTTTDGRDPAARLLAAGLARPYAGGRRAGWCATADAAR